MLDNTTPHGFTLTIREAVPSDPPATAEIVAAHGGPISAGDDLWVELRYNRPPTPEWEAKARGVLTRMSCSRVVEIHGVCASHSPKMTEIILRDALDALDPAVGKDQPQS